MDGSALSSDQPVDPRPNIRSASPLLRQRLGRAATFAHGVDGHTHPMMRRRSSVITESSYDDTRSRASADTFLLPRATGEDDDFHEERSHWESLPLLFAIVPAIGGVFYKNGSALATDFSLLALAAIYLNWCLRSPWDWYHSAQVIKSEDAAQLDIIVEEDSDNETPTVDAATLEVKSELENRKQRADDSENPNQPTDAEAAAKELRIHELCAMASCFVGPLFGAYLLHVIRSKLSTHLVGEGLVTNIHLTLFVLCAEIRPARYLIKMIQARTLHLQRLVRDANAPSGKVNKDTVLDIIKRVEEIEVALAGSTIRDAATDTQSTENIDMMKKIQSGLQGQIDPLNRAVRRYEKRTTAQAIQLEARLQNLEARLREALSLAAIAANYSQKPSIVTPALRGLSTVITFPLHIALLAVTYPITIVKGIVDRILIDLRLKKKRTLRSPTSRTNKSSSRHSSSGERGQTKTAKRAM